MIRKHILLTLLLLVAAGGCMAYAQDMSAARFRGGRYAGYNIEDGDTVIVVNVDPIYVFAPPKNRKQYERMVKNVKKVYPYAVEARQYMHTLETELAQMTSSRERERFTESMEKEIVLKYTPILEKMTYAQGKILIKLIDRETSRTPYQILRDFRGRFTAGLYNTVAKIFKADLKQNYDPKNNSEDAMIEQIVTLIEAGLL